MLDLGKIDLIDKEINYLNGLDSNELSNNYFSNIYSNKYFAINDAKKIGYIRDYIEENKRNYSEREYYYLISCLL